MPPPVDVHKRFMVIDVSEEKNEPHVFINPEIVAKDGGRVYQRAACRFRASSPT